MSTEYGIITLGLGDHTRSEKTENTRQSNMQCSVITTDAYSHFNSANKRAHSRVFIADIHFVTTRYI